MELLKHSSRIVAVRIQPSDSGILLDTFGATMRNKQKTIQLRDVQDVIDVIGGRWRGAVLASLCDGGKRFNDLRRDLGPITARTLTKELRYLEANKLVEHGGVDANVAYALTIHGRSLEPLIGAIVAWGQKHRKVVLGK